jgi:hypothetical protein
MHGILNELRDIGIQGEGRAHVGIIVPCICGIKMPGSSAGRLPTGDAHAGRRPVSTAARADRIMVLRTRTCTSQFHQNKLVLKTELF